MLRRIKFSKFAERIIRSTYYSKRKYNLQCLSLLIYLNLLNNLGQELVLFCTFCGSRMFEANVFQFLYKFYS